MFGMNDKVRILGVSNEVWTVKGTRDGAEPFWMIRLGMDAGTDIWKRTDELELVEKAKVPEGQPGFYPARGIMDY